jgi:hypothetical protein
MGFVLKKAIKLSDFRRWSFSVWCNMGSPLFYELNDHSSISKRCSFMGYGPSDSKKGSFQSNWHQISPTWSPGIVPHSLMHILIHKYISHAFHWTLWKKWHACESQRKTITLRGNFRIFISLVFYLTLWKPGLRLFVTRNQRQTSNEYYRYLLFRYLS